MSPLLHYMFISLFTIICPRSTTLHLSFLGLPTVSLLINPRAFFSIYIFDFHLAFSFPRNKHSFAFQNMLVFFFFFFIRHTTLVKENMFYVFSCSRSQAHNFFHKGHRRIILIQVYKHAV